MLAQTFPSGLFFICKTEGCRQPRALLGCPSSGSWWPLLGSDSLQDACHCISYFQLAPKGLTRYFICAQHKKKRYFGQSQLGMRSSSDSRGKGISENSQEHDLVSWSTSLVFFFSCTQHCDVRERGCFGMEEWRGVSAGQHAHPGPREQGRALG